jgi:hypothetical protein
VSVAVVHAIGRDALDLFDLSLLKRLTSHRESADSQPDE